MMTDRTSREKEYIDHVLIALDSVRQQLEDESAADNGDRVYWQDVAKCLGVSASSISRARKRRVPNAVIDALFKRGLIPRVPPKDPRPRVWMRTDDLALALMTIREHYPDYTIKAEKKQVKLETYPSARTINRWD